MYILSSYCISMGYSTDLYCSKSLKLKVMPSPVQRSGHDTSISCRTSTFSKKRLKQLSTSYSPKLLPWYAAPSFRAENRRNALKVEPQRDSNKGEEVVPAVREEARVAAELARQRQHSARFPATPGPYRGLTNSSVQRI